MCQTCPRELQASGSPCLHSIILTPLNRCNPPQQLEPLQQIPTLIFQDLILAL